ncbi:hypothetical protein FS837_006455 [Tulasnella sp. UAMH 9824]|nr:hypothetical protein FS837_006455 [Tulasnella sp. UAMH 9824]
MAHDDEELDWGEDDGWATEQVVATMDVDRPDLTHSNGDGSATQHTLNKDDLPHVSEKVAVSPEQKADLSSAQSATRNGGPERRDSRRPPATSENHFLQVYLSVLPQSRHM